MASEGKENGNDLYGVLGLQKECTTTDLKNAYKKLAMRWHPDRVSGSGNSKFVEDAKKKFQAIQEAYSVLSDDTKRFLYDVGVYDKDDDDNNHGMGDFLNEMVAMMSENKPAENGKESFEQLQELFEDLFQTDVDQTFSSISSQGSTTTSCSSSFAGSFDTSCFNNNNNNNKRSSSEFNNTEGSSSFNGHFQSLCRDRKNSARETRKGERDKKENHKEGSVVIVIVVAMTREEDVVENKTLHATMMSPRMIIQVFLLAIRIKQGNWFIDKRDFSRLWVAR